LGNISFAQNILLFSIEFVGGTIQISKNNFSFLKMNFLDYDETKTHPVIPYRNNCRGNFFNNNQFMNLGLEFNAFKDSPLKNISNIFNLLITRVEKQHQMDLVIFF